MQAHPNVQAVARALAAADGRDQSGQPTQIQLLPDAVHTAAAAADVA